MSYLSKKRVWTQQPTKPVTLNPKGDILAAIMPGMAFGAYRDRIAFPILDSGSAIGETFLSEGKAQKYRSTSSTSYKGYRLTIPSESSTRFVFLAYMRPSSYNASGYNSYVICGSPSVAGNEVWCRHISGKLDLTWRRASTTHLSISYDIAGQLPLGLYRFDFDGSVARILLNGEVVASGTPTQNPYLDLIQLGGNASSYVKTPDLLYSAYSNKILPDDYGVDNPWGIFSRGDRRIWIPSAGGGVHTTTSILTSDVATISGTSLHKILHTVVGNLTSSAATLTGTSVHTTPAPTHNIVGVLSASNSSITGIAARYREHQTNGILTTTNATINGTTNNFSVITSTGVLSSDVATLAGVMSITPAPGIHISTGVLQSNSSTITGILTHTATGHTLTGTLVSSVATLNGNVAHNTIHSSSGTLVSSVATINGTASSSGIMTLTSADIEAIANAVWQHPWALTLPKWLALK